MSKCIKQEVVITNIKGLHARPSAQVVKIAEKYNADLYITFQEMRVSALSIMGLLMLGAAQGSALIIEGEGEEAEQAISSLVELIENRFGEG